MIAAIVCGATVLTSCSNEDDPVEPGRQEYAGVPLIILDTDIGSSTDDLFTLMMLYRYQEQNRSRLLGVVVDREGEESAACADVMNTYYGHGDIPIGLIRDGIKNPNDEVKGDDGPDRRARMVQWRQLRDHILAHLDNRPVIVTGDLNSYYERDSICSQVFSVIEQTGRATVGDAWITLERDGKFPDMVEGPVTNDPGSTTWALKGQTLDKIIYINPTGGPQLKPLSFSVDSATYVRPDGKTPLGDHAPVSAKFRFLPR